MFGGVGAVGEEVCAQAAADANADGSLDISDPTYTLLHLFLGGPAHRPLTSCDL